MSKKNSNQKDERFAKGFSPQQIKQAIGAKFKYNLPKEVEEEAKLGMSQIELLKLAGKQ